MLVATNASSTLCIACTLILTLLEEQALQTDSPQQLCEVLLGHQRCSAPNATAPSPDAMCLELTLCDGYPSCKLFPGKPGSGPGSWPPPNVAVQSAETSRNAGGVMSSELASLTANGGLAHLRDTIVTAAASMPASMLFLPPEVVAAAAARAEAEQSVRSNKVLDPCGLNVSCIVQRIGDLHLPILDGDGDAFTPIEDTLDGLLSRSARGSHWRGADCNDASDVVYPGRRAVAGDIFEDTNCNGIHGVDPVTKKPYEHLWCSGANQPRGVAVLGDSAAAHFHIPPTWLSAANFSLDRILNNASAIRLADELDVPQCSWSTGHAENASVAAAQCPKVWRQPGQGEPPEPLPVSSIYSKLRERNLCNHRDFQNIGVNGARVSAVAPSANGIVNSLARNATVDVPLVLFHALIGNDVCNGHPGMGSMTTVEEFAASVNSTLQFLEAGLPRGSTVILIGLAQGTTLYNVTHNQTHPIGTSYPALYDYLSCLGVNPCWGWLNTNATWRAATQARADQLNAEYGRIVAEWQAQHPSGTGSFELLYYNPDLLGAITKYVGEKPCADGIHCDKTRTPMDCIEPGDGFHPAQTLQMLLADQIWSWLEAQHPQVLGDLNPFNEHIAAKFGSQGGY